MSLAIEDNPKYTKVFIIFQLFGDYIISISRQKPNRDFKYINIDFNENPLYSGNINFNSIYGTTIEIDNRYKSLYFLIHKQLNKNGEGIISINLAGYKEDMFDIANDILEFEDLNKCYKIDQMIEKIKNNGHTFYDTHEDKCSIEILNKIILF